MEGKSNELYVIAPDGGMAVRVTGLDFLRPESDFGYFERHILNIRHRIALKRALSRGWAILAPDGAVAADIHKYYRVPPERITVL